VVELKAFRLCIIMAESESSPRPSRSLYDSASSLPSMRRRRRRVEDFPSPHVVVESETLLRLSRSLSESALLWLNQKGSSRSSKSLYDSAFSWPSTKRRHDKVEGFLTPHRYGRIRDFAATE